MNAWAAQVAVNQQSPFALLGVNSRKVGGGRGFTLPRCRAGDQQGPEAAVESRQQNGISQAAHGLAESGQFGLSTHTFLGSQTREHFRTMILYQRKTANDL